MAAAPGPRNDEGVSGVGFQVRDATAGDDAGIRAVQLAAFPTPLEADLVEQLRRDGDVLLSLVARDGDNVVGHVLISPMTAEGDGRRFSTVGLGPVAVLPERQHRGIGSALVRAAIERMRAAGAELVFLVGEPDYYRRFGFDAATAAPFASPYAGRYFMALRLRECALPRSGRADYAPAIAALD